MVKRSVQTLIEDIRLLSETNFEIVEAVRAIVKQQLQGCTEEVKYGGILFSSGAGSCFRRACPSAVSSPTGRTCRWSSATVPASATPSVSSKAPARAVVT